eukprot:766480-Hanusia_phi.AAC.2
MTRYSEFVRVNSRFEPSIVMIAAIWRSGGVQGNRMLTACASRHARVHRVHHPTRGAVVLPLLSRRHGAGDLSRASAAAAVTCDADNMGGKQRRECDLPQGTAGERRGGERWSSLSLS